MDNRTQYVVGFLFDIYDHVSLIQKNSPAWQKGKYNGIGGHIEAGETPKEAMKREFFEEAGLLLDWEQYCTVYYTDAVIHFFRAFGTRNLETKTDEKVFWQPLNELGDNVIPNLHWLIPLALYTDTDMQQVVWTCRETSKELQSHFKSK
jgi:8-oxo-dGTP diphosphatase